MQCSVELDNNENTQKAFQTVSQQQIKQTTRGSFATPDAKQLIKQANRYHGRQSPLRSQQGSIDGGVPTSCTPDHRGNHPQGIDSNLATHQKLRPSHRDQLRRPKLAILRPPTTAMTVLLHPTLPAPPTRSRPGSLLQPWTGRPS